MGDFYEPTLLFRNNAIRRYSPQLSPIASVDSLPYTLHNGSSWMLNANIEKDNEVLNQSCSLNRLNIKSNYWKIPDNNMNLTSLSISDSETNPTLAISSANSEANLFIYELDLVDNYLTHHNTITLPNIHSMKWLPNNPKYLVTGNSKGYAHLISIPKAQDVLDGDEDGSAEICKRFNHKKHLRNKTETEKNASISKLNFFEDSSRLLSLYSNHLFYWDVRSSDSQSKPSPVSISTIRGIYNFDPVTGSTNNVGICGRFGVSLFDLRQPKFNVPPAVTKEASRRKLGSNLLKWSPTNENIFAAAHGDGVVRLWDIRKQDSFASLQGHQDKITSIEWNNGDIFTGGRDGNIIHWDLTTDFNVPDNESMTCALKEGLNSVNFNPITNSIEDTINQRQCGTALPASNTNIIGMCSVQGGSNDPEDLKVLSIDGSSFFGVHSKIYNAVNVSINSDKAYYTEEDIQLLLAVSKENSNSTLVESDVELESIHETKPLMIRRNTVKEMPNHVGNVVNNVSCDTLFEEEPHQVHTPVLAPADSHADFHFTPIHANNSAYSVDSVDSRRLASSPETDSDTGLFNDSVDTLSTHTDQTEHSDLEERQLNHDKTYKFPTNNSSLQRNNSLTPFVLDDFNFLHIE